jgi:hypothetical protein
MPFNSADLSWGDYTATYKAPGGGALDIGLFEGPVRFDGVFSAQDVVADRYGDTVIGTVYRGGNFFVTMVLKEWNAKIRSILNPYDTTYGQSGVIGRDGIDLSGELIFTAQPNTRAADEGPATRTCSKALILPGFTRQESFGNVQRDIPVVMRLFPQLVSGSGTTNEVFWFVDT